MGKKTFSRGEDRLSRDHDWCLCVFYVLSIAMSITVDILNYSCPLPFLASVLEDHGHSTMEIAVAVGVYYWAGFAGGAVITAWQIYKVVYPRVGTSVITASLVRWNLVSLVAYLSLQAFTLLCQAAWPFFFVHFLSRLAQGFLGAFIFFYAFLLAQQLFRGRQRIFALTSLLIALDVAEVSGSLVGGLIYTSRGQRAVFLTLSCIAMLNVVLLLLTVRCIQPSSRKREKPESGGGRMTTSGGATNTSMGETREEVSWRGVDEEDDGTSSPPSPAALAPSPDSSTASTPRLATPREELGGNWRQVRRILCDPALQRAVFAIASAAVVKGAVEEILPLFADHQLQFDPFELGLCFATIASCYVGSAVVVGVIWEGMGRSARTNFNSFWLCCLGIAALGILLTYKITGAPGAAATRVGADSRLLLRSALGFYGVCLGFTHTPPSLFLAEAAESFGDNGSRDAMNGIWNTMWEFGSSLGFLLGGLFSRSYGRELQLAVALAAWSTLAGGFLRMAGRRCEKQQLQSDGSGAAGCSSAAPRMDYGGTSLSRNEDSRASSSSDHYCHSGKRFGTSKDVV